MADITKRKQEHIKVLLQDSAIERQQTGFDRIQLTHTALPELNFSDICTQVVFLNKNISFPFLISSMTGGDTDEIYQINQNLAEAAEATQVAMAVGSQRIMLQQKDAIKSFELRKYAPTIPLIANIGAVQLNYGVGLKQIQRIIDVLEADAIYLHLNPLQEVVQDSNNTNFSNLLDKIAKLVKVVEVPVILKEVGCGLSSNDIQRGIDVGIKWFDIAGRGGTSWSKIESKLSDNSKQEQLGILFQDWGLTTVQSLAQARRFQDKAFFISSGGIRNGIDMVKSVIMGGRVCGVAAPLLQTALNGVKPTIDAIDFFRDSFKCAQFLLGMSSIENLFLNDDLILSS